MANALAVIRHLWQLCLPLALLAMGCATTQQHHPRPLRQWRFDSARIVLDERSPPCAFWAAREAMDVLRPRVDVSIERGAVREPLPGEIVVEWVRPAGALGLAWVWPDGKYAVRCRVQIDSCAVRMWAHELGHCAGLVNVDQPGRLMCGEYPSGGWWLTQPERDALRRR